MRNARLDEAQAGIKIARRNTNNLRYADDITLIAESEELKSLLRVKKVGLKLNIQKTKIMASGLIISWQISINVSQDAGKVVLDSHLFKNFPQFVVIHTIKGFGIVNGADVLLQFLCFFYYPTDVGNLISGSSAFSKSSLYIRKFSIHILLKPSLKDFAHYFASM